MSYFDMFLKGVLTMPKKGIKIRFLMGLLVVLTVISATIVTWISSQNALKSSLSENFLENNFIYAMKLSSSTSDLLDHMQSNMITLGNILGEKDFTQKDLDTWKMANDHHFNSIFIVDTEGIIQLISPTMVEFKNQVTAGTKITSETVKKGLKEKTPFISLPYKATSGQLILLISAPIFNHQNQYVGLVGGTIYLESRSSLNKLISQHELENGSYVYVVDHTGHIIYHPNSLRIGEDVSHNPVVKEVMNGKSDSAKIVNSDGKEFFSGYAYDKKSGWGFITQTPSSVIEEPLSKLLTEIIWQSLPVLLLILLASGLLTIALTKPINRLAKYSEEAIYNKNHVTSFKDVMSKSKIYEVKELYHHMNNYFKLMNNEIQVDGLTGVANRRTFDLLMNEYVNKKIPFSIILLDIDKFKKVNDTYGHLVGDDVLKYLSAMMLEEATEDDLCFRYGGEEFGLLLLGRDEEEAFGVAESLRTKVAKTNSPTGHPITISLGVTSLRENDEHPKQLIDRADFALYQSKANGRNQSTLFKGN